MKFTIYETATGKIIRSGDCEPDAVMLQAGVGETVLPKYAIDGRLFVIDPDTKRPVKREKTDEELLIEIRQERDRRLESCDWTQLPDSPVDKDAWALYRQQLRDLTESIDIRSFEWPTKPS